MIIKEIKINNFRSHKEYFLKFNKKTTMIVGENGCGKTSVLEAIYEGLRGKSFKATDKDILKRGEEFYRIELDYCDGEKTIVVYDGEKNKKIFQVQDKKFGRLPKKNKYPVVVFEPDDLNLIGASPNHKRTYFDRFFSQLSESYNNSLLKYNKALRQRNELLKRDFLKAEEVFSWNVMLAKYGTEISLFRKNKTNEINKIITETYRGIADNKDAVQFVYTTHTEAQESEYLQQLERCFEKDKILGHTSFGVHRDDFEFRFNEKEADGTASRGEIRSIILALKFIEAGMLEKEKNIKPLILLDDVFSELDGKRQKCLVRNFKDNQVIITSVKEA